MQIKFYNCPEPQPFDKALLPQVPEFANYVPDLRKIGETAHNYKQYKNLLIIGNGGSMSSFYGLYGALAEKSLRRVYFLNTVDPDYIYELKQTLHPDNTVVIAISKSGQTTTQIEALLQFLDYPLLCITDDTSPLAEIARKQKGEIVPHPNIGGRYTGFTEVALLPASICGFDIDAFFQGGRSQHNLFARDNNAWQAASIMYQLEQVGIVDVFLPMYSHSLFAMGNIIVQLCHESFGKDGKGQTYFAHEAPESQHHTNQRFFGGRKNIAGILMNVNEPLHEIKTQVPTELKDVKLKSKTLQALDGIPLAEALKFEWQGVLEDARVKNIPMVHLNLAEYSAYELGCFLGFWQLYTVYSSLLRGVDPFDQPEVESSKKISFDKRLQFKGLL